MNLFAAEDANGTSLPCTTRIFREPPNSIRTKRSSTDMGCRSRLGTELSKPQGIPSRQTKHPTLTTSHVSEHGHRLQKLSAARDHFARYGQRRKRNNVKSSNTDRRDGAWMRRSLPGAPRGNSLHPPPRAPNSSSISPFSPETTPPTSQVATIPHTPLLQPQKRSHHSRTAIPRKARIRLGSGTTVPADHGTFWIRY